MGYTTTEILIFYDSIEKSFLEKLKTLDQREYGEQFLELSGGLAATNSLHEMFIKSILKNHQKKYSISKTKQKEIVSKYKSPANVHKLINDLNLDLNEGFLLYLEELKIVFSHISKLDEVVETIKYQRDSRNNYLHGDFPLEGPFSINFYEEKIIKFKKLHSFLLKLIDYAYKNQAGDICNLSSLLQR